ncbi:BON domain-containing protein [Sphaerotilus sulfidivorans]|uniref:BON domain-containing protein n=1 Tax=Sphaerotilus sp. FB-3 TaxID=2913396 RepID=UPI00203A7DDF|nr:BON domain-containing protein [Sphaerotilus sp. FB-3]GKQ57327.1 hypothetical protein QMTAC487_11850 [Sphaerotilus sp. FB-3]
MNTPRNASRLSHMLSLSTPAARRLLTLTATAVLGLALAACGKPDDDRTVGQKIDGAVAAAEQRTEVAKAEARDAAAEVKADAKEATAEARASVDDAGITVAVNAALAGDPKLSALKIDVDTSNGRVELKGTAPDDSSRRRASDLARAVKGVVAVDNRLVVAKG